MTFQSLARLRIALILITIAILSVGVPAVPTLAQDRSVLGGTWHGGGYLVLPSGDRERANCRATFRNQGGSSYSMTAVCATASTRVQQSAEIVRTGGGNFAGSFYNAEYGISGSIALRLSGNRLSASLNGGGGSAQFSLRR